MTFSEYFLYPAPSVFFLCVYVGGTDKGNAKWEKWEAGVRLLKLQEERERKKGKILWCKGSMQVDAVFCGVRIRKMRNCPRSTSPGLTQLRKVRFHFSHVSINYCFYWTKWKLFSWEATATFGFCFFFKLVLAKDLKQSLCVYKSSSHIMLVCIKKARPCFFNAICTTEVRVWFPLNFYESPVIPDCFGCS